jgi:pyrroline-5-carboxylate reductase
MQEHIAIIGAGNLGIAIAEGLIVSGVVQATQITLSRRQTYFLDDFATKGCQVTAQNTEAVAQSDIVVLAVQPKQIVGILQEIKPVLNPERHILISVITGVSIADIQQEIGTEFRIARAMPNTAIAIRESMTCIAGKNLPKRDMDMVCEIFDSVGKTLIIGEELMAAATVLGACGIAFFMRFIRAASQGGIEVGFHAEEAQFIAAQTAKGAASLLLSGNTHPEQEIDKVTTPQGCTIAGLNEMEHNGLSSALIKGITTSYKKIATIK